MLESSARFLSDGGPFMWLILAVLGASIAVMLERIHFYFVVCRDDADELVSSAARSLNRGDAQAARESLEGRKAPLDVLLGVAVGRHLEGFSFEEVRRAVEEAALREVPRFSRRIGYLAMFANVATLAGLLGTIFGLQHSFSSLAIADASEKAALLAAGISQAMNTTAFGLMVAIPCMIAHAKLSSRQTHLLESLDAGTVRFLHYLESRQGSARPASRTESRGAAAEAPAAGRDRAAPGVESAAGART